MASTFYVDLQGPPVSAAWLNDVNALVYGLLGTSGAASTTLVELQTVLGLTGVVPLVVSVASATALTLPVGATVCAVTGTTNISSIVTTGQGGRTVSFTFAGVLAVESGSNLNLNGNFVTTAGSALTLFCDGTTWFEIGRKP